MLSLMAKEMAKEEHLRKQQGKESSKAAICREGQAVETSSFKEAEAANTEEEMKRTCSRGRGRAAETGKGGSAEA